jgi:hypothetical protein
MTTPAPEWPLRIIEAVADAASEVVPQRATVEWSAPSEDEPFWQVALTPHRSGATGLYFFVGSDGLGDDNFETASRSANFELWEPESERLTLVRQIVEAVIGGRCVEEVGYVGNDPKTVELRLGLPRGATITYRSTRRPARPRRFESLRAPERTETNTFEAY